MKIFLDMDGVLANFVKAVVALFEVNYDEMMQGWKLGYPGHYSVVPRLGSQLQREDKRVSGWNDDMMWDFINTEGGVEYWAGIEEYPWARDLRAFCLDLAPDEVYVVSAPARGPNSPAGKAIWLRQQLGLGPNKWMLGSRKDLLAKSDRILIDDSDDNVEAFRKAGGKAVLFPQVWNSAHKKADAPFAHVCFELGGVVADIKSF